MRLLVTGANGQLGRAIRARAHEHEIVPTDLPETDIADLDSIKRVVDYAEPDAIIHCAAYTDVDGCEKDPDVAYRSNALGSRNVALAGELAGVPVIAVSTDYIFDGTKGEPYLEYDEPNPLSVYGRSKLAGERLTLQVCSRAFIARTSWVYSRAARSFPTTMLRLASTRPELTVVADECGCPTFADDLADALLQLVSRREYGIYHLVNGDGCSRYELATAVLAAAGSPTVVHATTTREYLAKYPLPARRPADSRMRNFAGAAIGIALRPWQEAIQACFSPRD
jgi:dTDP-4-dehydrorhamnose reductase